MIKENERMVEEREDILKELKIKNGVLV